MNYSLAVILPEGCATDKEYNVLRKGYEATMTVTEAAQRALQEADGFVTIAEAWPVDSFPEHLQRDAGSGATGYVPFALPDWIGDMRPYAVDLNRISTVSWRALEQRIALSVDDAGWRQRLQTGLCRYFASRTIRLSADLQEIFQQAVVRAEAVGVPSGNPPRVRVRLHFENMTSIDLEAIQDMESGRDPEGDSGPGLHTRR